MSASPRLVQRAVWAEKKTASPSKDETVLLFFSQQFSDTDVKNLG